MSDVLSIFVIVWKGNSIGVFVNLKNDPSPDVQAIPYHDEPEPLNLLILISYIAPLIPSKSITSYGLSHEHECAT